MQPLVFFGSDEFSLPTLAALLAGGWPVAAVVTKPDRKSGRGLVLAPPVVKEVAGRQRIPVLQPNRLPEIIDELNKFSAQYGVVASYGKIIPDHVLELFPQGLINIHPSLLPKYRGPAPIEAAILNGDSATGVSLMQIGSQMDAGPIYAQIEKTLDGHETQPQLYQELAEVGARLLITNLPDILGGKLQPRVQDESQASLTHLIKKEDGQIDWSRSGDQIERQIRAYLTWPASRTELYGREVTIIAAHLDLGITQVSTGATPRPNTPGSTLASSDGEPVVVTGDGNLVIDRLKPAGRREMSGREFLAGLR